MMQKMFKKMYCPAIFLLLLLCGNAVNAQIKSISGVVTEQATGEPVTGASVQIKGTATGVITDINGNFKLNVPDGGETLVISFLGYTTQELPINQSGFNIVLVENSNVLDELVVIGYGSVRKKDLTGAISSVQGSTLSKVPVANVAQAMTGRMPGVQITTTDGAPDAEMVIRVRGGGSITQDNSPLFIVDGFPVGSISDISVNDIQDIVVLKDASSTAIYGAQGANGVVLITTKSAQGGKTTVSYNGFMQTKRLSKRMNVLNPYEYALLNYEIAALEGSDGIANYENYFGVYEDIDLWEYQKTTDWQDDMFGNDVVSLQHNVSITGGSEKTRFSLSGTYNKDGGLMPENQYSRFNGTVKLDHDLSRVLKLKFTSRIIDTTVDGSGTSGGTYKVRTSSAITKAPVAGLEGFKVVDLNSLTDEEREDWLRQNMTLSEEASQYWKKRQNKSYYFAGSLDWDIMKGLKYTVEGGYQYDFNETKNYYGYTTNQASENNGLPLIEWTKENRAKVRVANILAYDFRIKDIHHANIMVGQEIISSTGHNNWMKATGFGKELTPEKIFENVALGTGAPNIRSQESYPDNLSSFFGRLQYGLKDRYLLAATARYDGSSKFGPESRWGFFPSVALGWIITEESFMKSTHDWLSNLKMRVSYGEAGNNRIGSGLYSMEYSIKSTKTYGIDNKPNNYYVTASSQLANPNIHWEAIVSRNAGLDFGLFRQRLSGTLEFYWNSSRDLLLQLPIVAPGYRETTKNIGQTSNRGVELSFNYFMLEKSNYSLNASFNIGFNKSNVDKLDGGLTEMAYASGWGGTDLKGNSDYLVKVGEPLGLIKGWITDGYYTTDDFESYNATTRQYILKEGVPNIGMLGGRIGVRPGALKLKDIDGDGFVDDNDRTIIGHTGPKFTGGFGLNGTLYDFDLSVMFNFVYGNDIYNANKIASMQQYRTSRPNLLDDMRYDNRYTYLNKADGTIVTDLATLASMNEGANKKEYWSPMSFGNAVVIPHSWAVEDGSFLRLQLITLGYTLPKTLTGKFLCNQLRVYCTLNNVHVWTNYSGYDPEVYSAVRGSGPSNVTPGVDYSTYPKSFSWTLGLNLKF